MVEKAEERTEEAIGKDEMTTMVIPQHGEAGPAAGPRSACTVS